MDQDARALDVPQKFIPEPGAETRPLDEARHVDEHEVRVDVDLNDAELRLQRGEWIVRDLWTGGGDRREQRGLSRIRRADDASVGKQFELEVELALFARLAFLRKARRLSGRRREVLVAESAPSAARYQRPRAGIAE